MKQVIIIGSGPSGYTAAVYTGRANLSTLVIEGSSAGGQLMLTTEVENFPGFPDGIRGGELMMRLRQQAEKFGAEFVMEDVKSVDFSKRPFTLEYGGIKEQAQAVIIATGASPKLLGLPAEKTLMSRGVSVCATCDAPFFRNKIVIVVGGGDAALEEASVLAKFASHVSIIHRRDEFRASKIMRDRIMHNPKIRPVWNSVVTEISDASKGKVTGVKLKDINTGLITDLPCDGVFLAIGHKPNSDLFKGQLELDENGYIVKKNFTQTSVEGVFVCGDVADPRYRQAITAAGAGCAAALDAEKFLETL